MGKGEGLEGSKVEWMGSRKPDVEKNNNASLMNVYDSI